MTVFVTMLTGCAGSKIDPIYTEMDNKKVTDVPEKSVENYDFTNQK